jgi:dienelactone hydrolase
VVTVELPPLAAYRLAPATTDMIEDAARWVRGRWVARLRRSDHDVGLMGISFGGGLAVVAASRLGKEAAWVLSLGGHGDLRRTLRYLAGEVAGQAPPPHDYGLVIILLNAADRLVPDEQIDPLRRGILSFLQASHLDMVDKAKAAAEFARAREMAESLPEPARTYLTWVNERNVGKLGAVLLPLIQGLGADAAMSPELNPPPAAPVYLLHGSGDNVIPAAETERLARDLAQRGGEVTHLVTPLITHAEVDRPPSPAEVWRLVRFWAAPL